MKCSLAISNFLGEISVFPILLLSSMSLHWSWIKGFLSLLAIFWNSAFKWEHLSSSPLLFTSFLFTAFCEASSDSHFAFFHFFFLGMVLSSVSCTMSWTSIHSSSGTLSIRSISYLRNLKFLKIKSISHFHLYSHKGFDLGHTWMVWWFSPFSSISVWIWQ